MRQNQDKHGRNRVKLGRYRSKFGRIRAIGRRWPISGQLWSSPGPTTGQIWQTVGHVSNSGQIWAQRGRTRGRSRAELVLLFADFGPRLGRAGSTLGTREEVSATCGGGVTGGGAGGSHRGPLAELPGSTRPKPKFGRVDRSTVRRSFAPLQLSPTTSRSAPAIFGHGAETAACTTTERFSREVTCDECGCSEAQDADRGRLHETMCPPPQ